MQLNFRSRRVFLHLDVAASQSHSFPLHQGHFITDTPVHLTLLPRGREKKDLSHFFQNPNTRRIKNGKQFLENPFLQTTHRDPDFGGRLGNGWISPPPGTC